MRTSAVNYEKYENMSRQRLLDSLADAQKKEQDYQNNLQNTKELIKFLKSRLKESTNKQKFIPISKSKVLTEIYNSITPQEHEKLRAEIQQEMAEASK